MQELIHYFSQYVEGKTLQIENHFDEIYLKLGHNNFKKTVYSVKLSEIRDEETQKDLGTFLKTLGIPAEQHKEYLNSNLTLYKLLESLRQRGHRRVQIDEIMTYLDKKIAMAKWKKALLGIIGIGALIGATSQIGLLTVVNYIQFAIAAVGGIPVIGLAATVGLTLFTLYTNQTDQKRTFFERFIDNLFVAVQAVLNIASYAFWIAAATVAMTPLVASLSVAAAAIDFVKETFLLVSNMRDFFNKTTEKKRNLLSGMGNLEQAFTREKDYLEAKAEFKMHLNSAAINLLTVVALIAITAVWNFFPPAMIVTVTCAAAMVTVYVIKTIMNKRTTANITKELQKELSALDNTFSEDVVNAEVHGKQNVSSNSINKNNEKRSSDPDTVPDWHQSNQGENRRKLGFFDSQDTATLGNKRSNSYSSDKDESLATDVSSKSISR